MTAESPFTKKAGKEISNVERKVLIDTLKKQYKDKDEYVNYQFFGADLLQKLLANKDAVGIVIHYGIEDQEGSYFDERNRQLIVSAIDTNGKIVSTNSISDGPKCPYICNPPVDPDI